MSLEKYLEAMEKGTNFADVKLDEALPPHLAKLVDEKGNLKDPEKQKSFEKMIKKTASSVVRDVTPKGYGVKKEEVEQIDEAGTAHPIPGHEYHKKTDAELRYIAKDAKEAEDAMSGHNPKAANKYADQKNDAATVLHFRSKGMPDWYKKKYGHLKEDVDNIDEEKDTSALDAMDAKEKRKEKIRKFIKNQSPLKIKRTTGVQKEEIELNEGSERPRYTNVGTKVKIHTNHKNAGKIGTVKSIEPLPAFRGDVYHVEHEDGSKEKYYRENIRRHVNEDVEQIDELSDKTLDSYKEKAKKDQSDKVRKGDFDGALKRDRGIQQSYVAKYKNLNKKKIEELSNELLDRYKKKAGESAREADAKGDFKKGDKRFKGIVKATNKQFDNDLKKESVEIDETDKSYVKNLPTWKLEDLKKAREGMKNADDYKKAEADELEKRKKVKEEVESINEEIDNHINRLTKALTDRSKASSHEGLHTEFSAQHGQKYTKIVGTTNGGKGTKSVHAFVHKETGDVYKPAGWNAPAKGARYNLHKHIDHLEKHADQYGSYLYKHK